MLFQKDLDVMIVKRKDMKNDEWFRIIEKRYISKPIQFNGDKGIISLNVWDKVTAPLTVSNSKYDVKIADDGYKWIQVAFENRHLKKQI